ERRIRGEVGPPGKGRPLMDSYNEIMKIAFQAEEALDDAVIARFGRRFKDKQILIKEGEIQQKIFWILDGEVYITRRMGDKYKVLATLGKGELIGEMSFFDKSVRSATVIAKNGVHALEFTRENFADIYAASPMWTRRLLVSLAKRIRQMVEKLGQF
ncbi:MAG: cyclic nucleotide-binding domain-containing protein, partial [Spirochaetia bacterium]